LYFLQLYFHIYCST